MLPASRTDQLLLALSDHVSPFQLWAFWEVPGHLDEHRLRRAVAHLVARIPVLGCRLAPGWWRDRWVPLDGLASDPDLLRVATVEDRAAVEAASAAVVASFVDVRRGPALRLHLLRHRGGDRLILHLHHCLVDGRGLVRVMQELAACYRRLGREPGWRPTEPLPPCRSTGPIFRGLALRHWLRMPFSFVYQNAALARSRSRIGSFAMDRGAAIDGVLGAACHTAVAIADPPVSRLLARCRARSVTLNDYLTTAALVALHRWNGADAVADAVLPLLFAGDLRQRYAPGHAPIANIAALHYLLVPRAEVGAFAETLVRVKARIDRVKRRGFGLDALFALWTLLPLPAALFRFVSPPILRAMGRLILRLNGFTNIGVIPDDAGWFDDDLAADHCSILASIFPVQTMLLTATTYRDRLTVQLGYDGRGLSAVAAGRFGALLSGVIRSASED